MVDIFVITEGLTEREVGKVLYEKGMLRDGKPKPTNWTSIFGQSREGYSQVIEALANHPIDSGQRILLVFDQEDLPSPQARAERIAQDLSTQNPVWSELSWEPLMEHTNLFKTQVRGACIVLHVSTAVAPSITNKDFDGYILELLRGPQKEDIALQFASSFAEATRLLRKAEVEFTQLMQANGFPWQRNKAWLYAYITAFQFRQSHVWFAKRVVESAPDDELRRVFASLIHAWDWLVRHGGVCS